MYFGILKSGAAYTKNNVGGGGEDLNKKAQRRLKGTTSLDQGLFSGGQRLEIKFG